jgi:hypothetical protein
VGEVRENAGVKSRSHDNRHTLVTELADKGAGAEVIMGIAGHVSRAMLSRYSHVRTEAKRRALEGIAAQQRMADQKRRGDYKIFCVNVLRQTVDRRTEWKLNLS